MAHIPYCRLVVCLVACLTMKRLRFQMSEHGATQPGEQLRRAAAVRRAGSGVGGSRIEVSVVVGLVACAALSGGRVVGGGAVGKMQGAGNSWLICMRVAS